jgi:ketosteroid isomerase-like protein
MLTADDHAAIQQLYARYNHAIDLGDVQGWVDTFTPDGTFASSSAGEFKGSDALAGFATGFGQRMKARHWTNNLVLEESDGAVKGSCYLILWNLASSPASILITGIYDDRLVKVDGAWKFTSRVVKPDA